MNPKNKFEKNELGALCELAFWKFMFPLKPWKPAPMKGVDVGDFQVRGALTNERVTLDRCRLIIRPWDRNEDRVAMVIRFSPIIYIVRGWIEVCEGRKVGIVFNPNGFSPAYWVEQSKLKRF